MTLNKFSILILSAAVLFSGCAKMSMSGVTATAYFDEEKDYSRIVINGPMDVEFSESVEVIAVSTDTNLLPFVEVECDGGELKIGFDDDAKFNGGNVITRVVLPVPDAVESINLGGKASVLFDSVPAISGLSGADSETSFKILLSGASSFTGSVEADNLDIQLSGASICSLSGKVKDCIIDLHGASSLIPRGGEYLRVDGQTSLTVTDASSISFYSDGTITGTLSGVSTLSYGGNADCSVTAITSTIEKF